MANLDTAAKRAAGLAVAGFVLVLPIPDASDADSILQRAHLSMIYGSNTTEATPLDLTGLLRVTHGHGYKVSEGHEHKVVAGHVFRIVEWT